MLQHEILKNMEFENNFLCDRALNFIISTINYQNSFVLIKNNHIENGHWKWPFDALVRIEGKKRNSCSLIASLIIPFVHFEEEYK